MNISIPKLSLVVLVGPSGSGKSTFAARHFRATEILSSDVCRGIVSDDPNDQSATNDAFDVLYYIARKRLAAGRLTVIDATNVQADARRPLVALAREFHVLPVAIVLDLPEKVCLHRNRNRSDRDFPARVIRTQRSQLRQAIRKLKREGFRHVNILDSEQTVDAASIQRVPLWNDKSNEHGPFDFIGDVHNCCDELEALLAKLGYQPCQSDVEPGWSSHSFHHPDGRKVVFVGDLVDRGPRAVDTVSIVRNMVRAGAALCVPGNHDVKLLRHLKGKQVQIRHGLQQTLDDVQRIEESLQPGFKKELAKFIDGMISHYVLDDGKIVVAHAGLPESMHGRGSGKVRSFALYGETTGETDEFGLPIRHNWAADYRGDALVVYGHTPVPRAEWLNRTIDIDTGCVFGGKLTALRYPELELVDVPAARVYCEPARPLEEASPLSLDAQQIADDLLDAQDVIGKRHISTRLKHTVTIRQENATAALEIISRFAVDPKWLIYLPPTMSPTESSGQDGFLEHPIQAFDYFRSHGIDRVVCQRKHMGSRAVVVVCKDPSVATDRFGIAEQESGVIYTRTGRRFFNDRNLEGELIQRIVESLGRCDFWERFSTEWVCLDCELMPWSAKARELLQNQYAAVGAAAGKALPAVIHALEKTANRMQQGEATSNLTDSIAPSLDLLGTLVDRFATTQDNAHRFVDAYRTYCWDVNSVNDYRLAPFHILASEQGCHIDKDHLWHMSEINRFSGNDLSSPQNSGLLMATEHRQIDLNSADHVDQTIDWWIKTTEDGSEGMVVKPLNFVSYGKKGLIQPAVKCRGKEYLRIIYGPDYDLETNLKRLRNRHLGRKRSLALREFALGIESLERFVARQPLRKVHECVFGVLALESEPVDPRL